MAKKGLGRGLGALLGEGAGTHSGVPARDTNRNNNTAKPNKNEEEKSGNVSRETPVLKLSMIEPNPMQPRRNFEETSLSELADSIKEHGVLQPIIVKRKGRMYEIIAGERRWRAARLAGLKEIPAIIREMDNMEAAEASLIENIQREDLDCIEEAMAYKALIEEYGLTQEELSKKVSKSRAAIANSIRLLQLEGEVLSLVADGSLSAGHARAILSINGKRNQLKAAKEAVSRQLNVRQTEKLAKQYNAQPAEKPKMPENKNESGGQKERELHLRAVERELTEAMNTKVAIRETGKNKGRIEIEYYTNEELNELIEKLR